jgi:rhamnulokinase
VTNVVAAVDCGATSVRVCRVDLDAPSLVPQIVHRVAHSPRRDAAGNLRWDWSLITAAVIEGLERARDLGPLASIGVDTWAVDYGLLDDSGTLIGAPYAYRDHRTDGYRSIVDAFGAERMYRINGLQLLPFNTIFQLAVHDHDELRRAARLLWLPELILHHLTGVAVTERTSAGSSGLVDVTTGAWSPELLDVARVDDALLGDITPAGRVIGAWRDVPVALVGGHDTASAVAGMGSAARRGSAFVATGTWILAGLERDAPDVSDWARARNYTNEAGALGGFRFLRNVAGFWLLEQCRAAWGDADVATLVEAAERIDGAVPIVDVDDPGLLSPTDMLGTYTALAGLPRSADPGLVTRSIVESIVARTAATIAELAQVATFDDVVVFGGAARMDFLLRLLARRTGRSVRVGPAEASAVGNAIVQGVAIGTFSSLDDGRARLGGQLP